MRRRSGLTKTYVDYLDHPSSIMEPSKRMNLETNIVNGASRVPASKYPSRLALYFIMSFVARARSKRYVEILRQATEEMQKHNPTGACVAKAGVRLLVGGEERVPEQCCDKQASTNERSELTFFLREGAVLFRSLLGGSRDLSVTLSRWDWWRYYWFGSCFCLRLDPRISPTRC